MADSSGGRSDMRQHHSRAARRHARLRSRGAPPRRRPSARTTGPAPAAVRSLLAAMLFASAGGGVWAGSLVVASEAVPAAGPAATAQQHPVGLPPVPVLELDSAQAARPLARSAPTGPVASVAATTRPAPDPLVRWAAEIAPLLGVPESALVGYGAADLATQQATPGCRLSWITLAAIGQVGSAGVAPEDGRAAALATAEALCAGDRDTSTADGWVSAVRSVGDGAASVQQVLAVATMYATAVRTGVPLRPAAATAIDFAAAQVGLPYVWGGNGPQRGDAGFDCSGLTTAAYDTAGVDLPRTAHTQYFATARVAQLRPGDLVFYGNPATKIHHVGLYIGNGHMINAPTFGQPVQVEPYRSLGDHFAGAGRPVT
ncbi:MAG: NlpC/P60 family protein [Pseudonocardiaceae bacterium]|nr:NlpC/P60 family protein [Pseudonocardiaceae bacterium]